MKGISVVIISRGRVVLLEELIKSVKKAQSKTSISTEIILVDSSLGSDKNKVFKLCKQYQIKYYYTDITVSGKRNYGANKASYDYILFLDSDCIVTESIFNCYVHTLQKHPDAAGSCGPLEFFGEDSWKWKIIESTPYTIFFSVAYWGEKFVWAPTANLLVKKDVFIEVGGFDETFPKNPGGEDVDFGLRIKKAGYDMYTTPEALVLHNNKTWCSFKSMFKRVFNYGRGDFSLVERHQDMMCDSLPKRILIIVFGMLLYIILGAFVNPWMFLGAFLTPVYEVLLNCILLNEGKKKISIVQKVVVQLFFLWNEAGYLKGCIEEKRLRSINKQFIHFKPQLDGVCYRNYILSIIYGIHMTITAIILLVMI